jgi:hypothetical protein
MVSTVQKMPHDNKAFSGESEPLIAAACFNPEAQTLEPFGVFPSLARFSEALEAECCVRGYRLVDPVAVDQDGLGTVEVANAQGKIVLEYHLVANDGSRYGRHEGVAAFSVDDDEDGLPFGVSPCGVYASEAEIQSLEKFTRKVSKGAEFRRVFGLTIPF